MTTLSKHLDDLPYDKWREYDHEDTLRFYALRMHGVGLIKSTPRKIIADGTDWRFPQRVEARAEGLGTNQVWSDHDDLQGGPYDMPMVQSRRRFLTTLAAAGAGGILRARRALATEAPLETTSVRFMRIPSVCHAPQYVAEEMLRAEGFTDIRYVEAASSAAISEAVAHGQVDFNLHYAPQWVSALDGGAAVTVLAGLHVGCFELFGNESIRNIVDLKGKSVGVAALGSSEHLVVSVMAAHIGLDPVRDIHWVTSQSPPPAELFADGKIDAFLGLPPVAQNLRARHVGHVVVNSTIDHPWSQYFCCMLAGNREFVRNRPVATKRVLRALLKAADLCVTDPGGVARRLVDGGFTARYDYALQALRDVPYDRWREYDHEDTLRFYALRMHEVGLIKSSPQKIIADGTDWRFLNELKRELKT
jgi:NitT/TauT family transport system substrate-binding protein